MPSVSSRARKASGRPSASVAANNALLILSASKGSSRPSRLATHADGIRDDEVGSVTAARPPVTTAFHMRIRCPVALPDEDPATQRNENASSPTLLEHWLHFFHEVADVLEL